MKSEDSILMLCDNENAIKMEKNLVFRRRTKHLEIICHLVRDHVKKTLKKVKYIASKDQDVDIVTKPLSRVWFENLRCTLSM